LAKVTGPLFSLDASGKFADSLVFAKWKGINTVRQYAKPTNVNSAKQQAVKKAFSASSAMYKTLLGPDKEAWKIRSTGMPMSGYNVFMGLAVKALKDLRAFTLINKVQVTNLTGSSADILITASEDGEARLEYGNKPGSYYESIPVTLQKDTEVSVSLTGLTADIDYYFRIIQDDVLLDTPENLVVSPQGTEGTTVYGYKVTAISKAGETLPCAEVSISNGADVLSETDYNQLNWDPVPNAMAYAVYRSSSEGDPASTGMIAVIDQTNLDDTGLTAKGEEPTENTAVDHRGESGDYNFITMS